MKPGRRSPWALVVIVLAICTFAGSALAPDGSGNARPFAVSQLAGKSAPNPLAGRLEKVYGTNIPASRYGTENADLENDGTNLAGEQVSELSPLPASAFDTPEREYRVYAERWIAKALTGAAALRSALAAGERPAAITAWEATWSDYLHLGAVYGLFEALDQAIDGGPGGHARGSSDPRFTGLSRIETGLWSGAPTHSLVPYATQLASDLRRLHGVVSQLKVTPLEYATRSHEILEDAQRDFLSGMDVEGSRQGVLGTAAGLAATEEVFHTLEPLLSGRENTEGEVRTELGMLAGVLGAIRAHHGGRYPSLAELGRSEHEQLNGYVAGALSALQEMPGTLETEVRHAIPKLPASG
jgi:iron uptake system EfeUOB component EfeO/EfeM